MPHLPTISGKALLTFLQVLGFIIIRVKGSHHRMKHADGRISTIPVHRNQDIPKGLLRKIIREDLGLELEEFIKLWDNAK